MLAIPAVVFDVVDSVGAVAVVSWNECCLRDLRVLLPLRLLHVVLFAFRTFSGMS